MKRCPERPLDPEDGHRYAHVLDCRCALCRRLEEIDEERFRERMRQALARAAQQRGKAVAR